MNKLSDLELITAIAKLEGLDFEVVDGVVKIKKMLGSFMIYCDPYNPLTDKALLFDLMAKYKVTIEWLECSRFVAGVVYVKSDSSSGVDFESDNNIPRAILECIVEAAAND